MWKLNIASDLKIHQVLVSTISAVFLAPEINSMLISPHGFILAHAGQVQRWLLLVTYKASFRCMQNQICLCGPSGGLSHDVVLQIWCVLSFAFKVIHFER